MQPSTRALLNEIIDYAGTFPPASLPLREAIADYIQVKGGANGWLLGRLIVPAANLREFEETAASHHLNRADLSIVFGAKPETRLDDVLAFASRSGTSYGVASFEFPPLVPSEIRNLKRSVPDTIEAFFEIPIDADLERRISAVEASGALAKVRTGGVTPGVFPNAADLVRFLEACEDTGVAFKATAGLHHCLRGCYPLTYEPGSATETMHGFLNVSIAAAIVHASGTAADAVDVLRESLDVLSDVSGTGAAADTLEFRHEGIVWRGRTISTDDIRKMRQRFFRSFGSCSVREPIEELTNLRLI